MRLKRMKNKKKSDLSITIRIILGITLLSLFTLISIQNIQLKDNQTNLQNILDHPSLYEGRPYQTSGRVMANQGSYIFVLDSEATKPVPVLFLNNNLKINDNIVVYGEIHVDQLHIDGTPDMYILAEKVHMANSEPYKYIISGIALIIFAFMFFKEWSFSWTGFQESE